MTGTHIGAGRTGHADTGCHESGSGGAESRRTRTLGISADGGTAKSADWHWITT